MGTDRTRARLTIGRTFTSESQRFRTLATSAVKLAWVDHSAEVGGMEGAIGGG